MAEESGRHRAYNKVDQMHDAARKADSSADGDPYAAEAEARRRRSEFRVIRGGLLIWWPIGWLLDLLRTGAAHTTQVAAVGACAATVVTAAALSPGRDARTGGSRGRAQHHPQRVPLATRRAAGTAPGAARRAEGHTVGNPGRAHALTPPGVDETRTGGTDRRTGPAADPGADHGTGRHSASRATPRGGPAVATGERPAGLRRRRGDRGVPLMAVYDRWHTRKPRRVRDKAGELVAVESCRAHKLFPSLEHGEGDRWQVRWRDERGAQKKANRPRKGGKSDEADAEIYAEALDAKVRTELNQGTYVDPLAGKITLEAYAKSWRKGLTSNVSTLEQIDSKLKVHIYGSVIGGQAMSALSKRPSMVQQWVKGLERTLGPGTIRVAAALLSSIFNAAIDDGIVARNPVRARSVKLPRRTGKQVLPWTLEQVEKAAGELPAEHRAMAYLGAGCGHRQGEAFAVAAGDVEFLKQQVQIRRQIKMVGGRMVFAPPKGEKERVVPLPDPVALRLTAHIAEFPPVAVTLPWVTPDGPPVTCMLLFARAGRRPLRRANFGRDEWPKGREAAGAPADRDNGWHVLRHTAASAWLAAGVDINTVAEWLGHSDPGFTLRTYTHLMPSAAGRGRRAMGEFFTSSARNVPSEGSQHA